MKNAFILSAVLAAAAISGQAFAGDRDYFAVNRGNMTASSAAGQNSRAEVQAQVLAAHKAGISTTVSETSEPTPSSSGSSLTREQVRQEAISAARSHEGYQGSAR